MTYEQRKEAMIHYGFGPDVMKQTKVCGHCGAGADAKQSFCKECGARLPNETLFDLYKKNHLFCTHCETVPPDSARFCPRCGRPLHKKQPKMPDKTSCA